MFKCSNKCKNLKAALGLTIILILVSILFSGCSAANKFSEFEIDASSKIANFVRSVNPPDEHSIKLTDSSMSDNGDISIGYTSDKFYTSFPLKNFDIVTIKFNGNTLDVPIVSEIDYVQNDEIVLYAPFDVNSAKQESDVKLTKKGSSFASDYKITKESFPMNLTIKLANRWGNAERYLDERIKYVSKYSDYGNLSLEEKLNFRALDLSGLKKNYIYRGGLINVDNQIDFAAIDSLLIKYSITNIINVSQSKENMSLINGYNNSYYSKQNILFCGVDDMNEQSILTKCADIIKFINDSNGPVFIHCDNGIYQTGVLCALLEAYIGFDYKTIEHDFSKSYYNCLNINENDYVSISYINDEGKNAQMTRPVATIDYNACEICFANIFAKVVNINSYDLRNFNLKKVVRCRLLSNNVDETTLDIFYKKVHDIYSK